MQGKLIYEFGPFHLDPRERLFSRQAQPVSLSPQLFSLLLVFVENAGHLLSNEELRKKIWGQVSVSEDALKVIVGNLRRALGDGQNGDLYIENVRKGGYRFIATVRKIEEDSEPFRYEINVQSCNDKSAGFREETQPRAPETPLPIQSQRPRLVLRRKAGYAILGAVPLLVLTAILISVLIPAPQLRVAGYLPLTSDGQNKSGGPVLTDGVRVYFAENGTNSTALATVAVAGGGTAIIPLPMHDVGIFDLSPLRSELLSGRFISDQEGNELWVLPLFGGSPRRIGELKVGAGATWSPDGRHIAFALLKGLYVANADGSAARKLVEMPGNALWPRWSPDGKKLRFTEDNYRNGEVWESLWEVGADGSNLHRLLEGWNNPPSECCGTWTPDGRFFIFQSTHGVRTDLWALSEKRSFLARDSPSPTLLSSGPMNYIFPAVSADGSQIFAVGVERRGELVRFDSTAKEFVRFLGGISATWVSFSRSAGSVAYIDYPSLTVWRAKSDGSERTQITFSPLLVDGFNWSPDEKWLALRARYPGKPWTIYLVPSAGGDAKPLIPSETEQGVPSWAADGRSIAFGDVPPIFGQAQGTEVIHILDVNTHHLSQLPGSGGLWTARWSPDGRSLAALTIVGQRLMLYDFTTKKWRSTKAADVNNPNWSSDGKYIYFDTEGDDRALRRVSVADGHVDQLTSLRTYPNLAYWWSGITPDNSPLVLRNLGTTEVYSLALETR